MEGRRREPRKTAQQGLIDCRWSKSLWTLQSPWGSKTVCSMWKGWMQRLQFLVQSTRRWLRSHSVRRMQQKLASGGGTQTWHLVMHYLSSSEMIHGRRDLLCSTVLSKLLKFASDIVLVRCLFYDSCMYCLLRSDPMWQLWRPQTSCKCQQVGCWRLQKPSYIVRSTFFTSAVWKSEQGGGSSSYDCLIHAAFF